MTAASGESFRLNFVVTCKGRLDHLKRTLPGLLGQSGTMELRVVVVDYGDPDHAFDYCRAMNHPRLTALRVLDGTEFFNLPRARNCGANLMESDVLSFVDADSILHPHFAEYATYLIRGERAVLTYRQEVNSNRTTCGVCCVRTDVFRAVRGYDEAFSGWGPEDGDFYDRVTERGAALGFPTWLYPSTLPHSNAERSRYYPTKSLGESCAAGRRLRKQRGRPINPNGYGVAWAEVFVPGNTSAQSPQRISEPNVTSYVPLPESPDSRCLTRPDAIH